jgi:DtxR family Mn-dependent transcriptional regulator
MKKTKEKEHYLKEIYRLEMANELISVSSLSKVLGVSKSSVSNMIKKLVVMNLLNSAPYKAIEFTSEGRELARTIVAKHRLIELFLVEVMAFEPENVHAIAEEIEHIESPAFFRKVKQMLSQRKIDPHGSPIPDVEF